MPRLFTLEEARALLPEIRPLVQEMQDRKQELDRAQELLARAGKRSGGNGHGPPGALAAQTEAQTLVDGIRQRIARLAELGVEVKGIDEGLIDFPAERDGRTVYLCWRLGEPDILHWHDLAAGFRGRQPL